MNEEKLLLQELTDDKIHTFHEESSFRCFASDSNFVVTFISAIHILDLKAMNNAFALHLILVTSRQRLIVEEPLCHCTDFVYFALKQCCARNFFYINVLKLANKLQVFFCS